MNHADRPNRDMALLVERAGEIARVLSPGPHRASSDQPATAKHR
ncbi:hypothetical protein [Rugamonas apoptosis]|nr:hypothetical protein [Rugamonas apoptosis]